MASVAKKPLDEQETDPPEDEDLDDDDGEDDDDDEEDDDEEEEDGDDDEEDEEENVRKGVMQALRDAHEACASAVIVGKKILLDLDDDTHWVVTVKRRDA